MRAIAPSASSIATIMACALAWMRLSASRAMATWPFQNMRSPRRISVSATGLPSDKLLHVAVARAGNARRLQRDLHEAGTIEPERGLAAPQIGRIEKHLGDGDEIACARLDRREVDCRDVPARRGDGKAFVLPRNAKLRAHRQRRQRRPFDVRRREAKRARHAHLVGRRRTRRGQRVGREPADIAVGLELAPGPAFLDVVDGDDFAEQRFCIEPRVVRRHAPQSRRRFDDLIARALDEALRFDLALQMARRDFGAERMDAGIERDHLL